MSTPEQIAEKKAERAFNGCLIAIVSAIAAIAYVVSMAYRYDMALVDSGCHYEAGPSDIEYYKAAKERRLDGHAHAVEWLWSKYRLDLGWRSSNYAQLRNGRALTPLVLHAICRRPDSPADPHQHRLNRLQAFALLRSWTSTDGSLGADDSELLEYPNYATSLALQCLVAENDPTDRPLIADDGLSRRSAIL